MADQKITQFATMTVYSGEDILTFVDDPNGTPVNKKGTVQNFLANLPANTSITGTLTVSGNTTISSDHVTVDTAALVVSNNATTQLGAGKQGSIFWDINYLYVAVSNTVIRRVALSDWDS